MRFIRGTFYNRRTQYGEFQLNGKTEWVQGELEYDAEKDCFYHYDIGPRGGEYRVTFY